MNCPRCDEKVDGGLLRCPGCDEWFLSEEDAESVLASLDREAILDAIVGDARSIDEAVLETWTRRFPEEDFVALREYLGRSPRGVMKLVLPDADFDWVSADDVPWEISRDYTGGMGQLDHSGITVTFMTGDPMEGEWDLFYIISRTRPFGTEQQELLESLDPVELAERAVSGSDASLQAVIDGAAREALTTTGVTEEEAETRVNRLWQTDSHFEILEACFPEATTAVRLSMHPEYSEEDAGYSVDRLTWESTFYVDPGGTPDVEIAVYELRHAEGGLFFTSSDSEDRGSHAESAHFPILTRWSGADDHTPSLTQATGNVLWTAFAKARGFDEYRQAKARGYHCTWWGDEAIARAALEELGISILSLGQQA